MAHKFIEEREVKRIIEGVYKRSTTIGLLCELCFVRNFRVGDVRKALASHIRKNNGYPEIYLKGDKTETNEWYPIPYPIYEKLNQYIKKNKLGPKDPIFEIETKQPGPYQGHRGIVTPKWVLDMWYSVCKDLGLYEEYKVPGRYCKECSYYLGNKKCKVLGENKIRNRDSIHINQCKTKGVTRITLEKHPRLHETLRGVGAISKIKRYMAQGDDYATAKSKVFLMSNWKSWTVFNRYMDSYFEKKEGDKKFLDDFGDMTI